MPRPTAGPPPRARIPGHRHAQIARRDTPHAANALRLPFVLLPQISGINDPLIVFMWDGASPLSISSPCARAGMRNICAQLARSTPHSHMHS